MRVRVRVRVKVRVSPRAIMAPKPDGEIHILPWMSPSAASYLGVITSGLWGSNQRAVG